MPIHRFECVCCGLLMMAASTGWAGPEVPGALPDVAVVLRGGIIHAISLPTLETGSIVLQGGKITAVGTDVDIPEDAQVIDVTGKHVYPGLIDSDTAIGLVEIEAVRATVDSREVGAMNPNTHALTAFNPDSELIPVARSDGILLALSVPRGSFVTGISALMQLDGWHAHDMALRSHVGLHVRWPPAQYIPSWDTDPGLRERVKRRDARLQELEEALRDAEAYRAANGNAAVPPNLKLEAWAQAVRREIPLMVHADGIREIQEAVAFAQRLHLRMILVGGYDAPRCVDLLKEFDIPVIVTGTHRLPLRRHASIHEPFRIPAQLQQAGVHYCLAGYDRFSASAIRNLPQHAGTAVAHGLTTDEALRAVTLSAAEILGVADRVGSIEPGKDATLIVTNDDILEIPSRVERAFIQGCAVDLDNRHKRLWRKYEEKYRRQAERPPE